MGSFAFYVYKVMFMSNTSFESDFVHIYIKTETTYDQLLNQVDPYSYHILLIPMFSIIFFNVCFYQLKGADGLL